MRIFNWLSGKGKGYFESDVPQENGLCSDNACPCDNTVILRGTGYLFIDTDLVEFRKKHPRLQDAINAREAAARGRGVALGMQGYVEIGRVGPILVCERGARLRGLDLRTASADATHWWRTGLVPLRATPKQMDESAAHGVNVASPPESPLEALLFIFNRDFSPKDQIMNSVITHMSARGHTYSYWLRPDTPKLVFVSPKAQEPSAYMPIALIQFRMVLGERASLKNIEVAQFQGSEGVSGVILSHWKK